MKRRPRRRVSHCCNAPLVKRNYLGNAIRACKNCGFACRAVKKIPSFVVR